MAGNALGKGKADRAEGLAKAIDNAWDNAKQNGAEADKEYKIEISIIGNNPIRTYLVVINP